MAFSVHRVPAALGAEIRGVDLSRALDDETFRDITAMRNS